MKKQIDVEKREVTLIWGDEKKTYTINGLTPYTCVYLALEGIASKLHNRKNPDVVYKRIKEGKKEKKYPATVVATAKLHQLDIQEVYKDWLGLSRKERMAITQDPEIQIEIQRMKIDVQAAK